MDLDPQPLTWPGRALLLAVIAFGVFSVFYLGDFWFFSSARRQPVYFALLSFAIFWGVYRSLINWYIYFFITPPAARPATRDDDVDILITAMPGEPFAMFEETLPALPAMSHAPLTLL